MSHPVNPTFQTIVALKKAPQEVAISFSGINSREFETHLAQQVAGYAAQDSCVITVNGERIPNKILHSSEAAWVPTNKVGQKVTTALLYIHTVEGGKGKTIIYNYLGAETGNSLLCIAIRAEGAAGDQGRQFTGHTWLQALYETAERNPSISTKFSESLVAALNPDNESFMFNGNRYLTPDDYPIWFQEAVVVTIEKIRNSGGAENSKTALTYDQMLDWTYFTPLGQLERFLLESRLSEQGERLSDDFRWEMRLKESAQHLAAQWEATESPIIPPELVIPGAFPKPEKKSPRLRLFRRTPS